MALRGLLAGCHSEGSTQIIDPKERASLCCTRPHRKTSKLVRPPTTPKVLRVQETECATRSSLFSARLGRTLGWEWSVDDKNHMFHNMGWLGPLSGGWGATEHCKQASRCPGLVVVLRHAVGDGRLVDQSVVVCVRAGLLSAFVHIGACIAPWACSEGAPQVVYRSSSHRGGDYL